MSALSPDGYIARLVKKGFRVAICEQVEDPRKAKGVVQRAVVRVVSPGTLTDASYLTPREPAFLLSLVVPEGARGSDRRGDQPLGAALIDLSTGEFSAAEYSGEAGLQAELYQQIGRLKMELEWLKKKSGLAD